MFMGHVHSVLRSFALRPAADQLLTFAADAMAPHVPMRIVLLGRSSVKKDATLGVKRCVASFLVSPSSKASSISATVQCVVTSIFKCYQQRAYSYLETFFYRLSSCCFLHIHS